MKATRTWLLELNLDAYVVVRASSLRTCGQVRATVSQACSSTPTTTSSSPSTAALRRRARRGL